MKATFIGVPGEDLDAIYMYGQTFPKGKAVTVTSPQALRKLANHPHFQTSADASDDVEDAKIKREFSGAFEAALAEKSEAPAPTPAPEPRPAPTPEPTRAPVHSASEYQTRYEMTPPSAIPAMPDTVKSAAEYQDMEMRGATNGNADAERTGDANPSQDQGGRSAGRGGRGRSGGRA